MPIIRRQRIQTCLPNRDPFLQSPGDADRNVRAANCPGTCQPVSTAEDWSKIALRQAERGEAFAIVIGGHGTATLLTEKALCQASTTWPASEAVRRASSDRLMPRKAVTRMRLNAGIGVSPSEGRV